MQGWHTGRLLVAAPSLDDPNFERTVLLVLDHDEDGALGVVLNRVTSVPVRDELDAWSHLAADPPVVFGGGPVEPTAVVALGHATATASSELDPDQDAGITLDREQDAGDGGTRILDRIRLVDLGSDPVLAATELQRVRIFAGYAGWAPDQLEDEIAQGAWYVVDAAPDDVFTDDPGTLWHDVLRRQDGPLKLLATYPADPSLN
ncbi:MAG: YqgE/AlgH family protein [Nitriliruptoraceae bacterium]|nr:YqgE/AlgH family protein [Nitriliruptoraceae bacterium]